MTLEIESNIKVMEDQSIFNQASSTSEYEYINDCIKEICLKGDSLSKYQKLIERKYGTEFYQKCDNFVEEVHRSLGRKKFTTTSVANLKYLAKEIHVPEETVDLFVNQQMELFKIEGDNQPNTTNDTDEKKPSSTDSIVVQVSRNKIKVILWMLPLFLIGVIALVLTPFLLGWIGLILFLLCWGIDALLFKLKWAGLWKGKQKS